MPQTITVNSKGRLSHTLLRKAPNDVMSVAVDYDLFFDTDTASTLSVTADSGITVDSSSVSSNIVTIVLSGGSDGYTYDITCKLKGTTETKEVIFQVQVREMDQPSINDYWYQGRC